MKVRFFQSDYHRYMGDWSGIYFINLHESGRRKFDCITRCGRRIEFGNSFIYMVQHSWESATLLKVDN